LAKKVDWHKKYADVTPYHSPVDLPPHIVALAKEAPSNPEAAKVLEDWCLENGLPYFAVLIVGGLSK
jgi:hypothetical protein